MSSTATSRANPFPGLRPFEENEDDLFFGRDDQIDDLVGRLRRRRLIAVIGTSGSGKSSLVRAGLLPALHGGFMAGAGSRWRIATMRPGGAPIANLADALDKAGLTGPADIDRGTRVGLARAGLDRGSLGLVDVLRESDLGKTENVLLLVDQFEELFRFQQEHPNEAAAFVKLLLTGTESPDVPLYVILTMRSDFLGDCAQFEDLAYRINDALFLVPRMTWEQLREAIEMPVRAAGADIDPALVTRLLNDLGDNPDQLPVLQHALMRTWDLRPDDGRPIVLSLEDLARTGGLDNALSRHGDAVLAALDESDRIAAEKMFKCVTELASDNRGIRRPTRLGAICAITGTSFEQMSRVVEAFRAPGCSFLAIRPGPLTENTVVDIAHEGLMRIGHKLAAWVLEEAASAQQYRRLATAATLHAQGLAALWRNPDLQIAETWREKEAPNAAWSRHVDPRLNFEQTMTFLDQSIEDRRRERAARTRRIRLVIGALTALVLVMAAIAAYAFQEANIAARERAQSLISESHFLARDANAAVDRGDAVTGTLLALEAVKIAGANRPQEAEFALENAYINQKERLDLLGSTDAVEGVAFSPDGKRVVSGAGDSIVRIWDATTGAQLAALHGQNGGISWSVFSPDGRFILSSATDKTARIWNANTGALLETITAPDAVESATYSPDGKRIVTASDDHTARIWSVAGGRPGPVMRGHTNIVSYAVFSHDGTRVATASTDETARIWDAATGAPIAVLRGHTAQVQSVAWSPDDRYLASASLDGSVRIWDTASHQQVGTLAGLASGAASVLYSPDGRQIMTTTLDNAIHISDATTYQLIGVLGGHDGPVNVAAYSPDGKRIVSGSDDRTVRIWDLTRGVQSKTIHVVHPLYSVDFSPDGRRVIAGGDDPLVRVWDTNSLKLVSVYGGGRLADIATFSPDGRYAAATTGRRTLLVWNAASGKRVVELRGHTAPIERFSFSPDGRRIATASNDKTVRVWDAASGRQLYVVRGPADWMYDAEFSPDGKLLATASADDLVRILDASNGRRLLTLRGHQGRVFSAAFSPDGKRLVTASWDRTARVWDVATGNVLAVLYGHQAAVGRARYTPDGKRIITSSADRTVRIWDANTGAQEAVLTGQAGIIWDCAVSRDGLQLATVSDDKTLRIWDIRSPLQDQALIDAATASVPRALTAYQREQEFLTDAQP